MAGEDEDEVMTVEDEAAPSGSTKTEEKPKVVEPREDEEDKSQAEDYIESDDEVSASGADERVGHDEDEETETTEQRRERRRQERRKKVERNRRDRVELGFLRKRNEDLERRFSDAGERLASLEDATIDQRITGVKGQIDLADQVIAKAIEKQSGTDVVEATRIRDNLRDSLRELESLKGENRDRYETEKEETAKPQAAHPHIGEIRKRASEWVSRNKWFDPKLGNQDSMVARAVEQAVANEGYDPTSKDYWDELDDRLRGVLPHQFKKKANTPVNDDEDEDDEDERPEPQRVNGKKPSGGPRLSSGGRERPLRSNEVYISADRRAAMEEAGVWDDPVLRNRYLNSYRTYDKEHGGKRR